jgi:hypothetical protein
LLLLNWKYNDLLLPTGIIVEVYNKKKKRRKEEGGEGEGQKKD